MAPGKLLIPEHAHDCPFLPFLPNSEFKSVVDFSDIQGDIIAPFPKRFEDFIFFTITDAVSFKRSILPKLLQRISSAQDVIDSRKQILDCKRRKSNELVSVEFVNIGFSNAGLTKLIGPNHVSDLNDHLFETGQLKHAGELGDMIEANKPKHWLPEFIETGSNQIDGVLLVASEAKDHLSSCCHWVDQALSTAAKKVYTLKGKVRDGALKDHEHFGWKDGISNPFLDGVYPDCRKTAGQRTIKPGVILVGHEGDIDPNSNPIQRMKRPEWAINGSFLAYRQLDQFVPEFHSFVRSSIQQESPGVSNQELERRAKLRAAQFVGRWPSGAPLELSPSKDNNVLANDPDCVNNFKFDLEDQTKCPFSAHIRKMNPRLPSHFGDDTHSVVRAGITYGEGEGACSLHTRYVELLRAALPQEKETVSSRGLAFVGYQSRIDQGFAFQQRLWANNRDFPHPLRHEDGPFVKGLDPLIGQIPGRTSLNITGSIAAHDVGARTTTDIHSRVLKLNDFVIAKGGGYFFVPPIKMLHGLTVEESGNIVQLVPGKALTTKS
ncbi:unnamed protein product [Rhizoctonia solani]|uniref:DyP dimeric alpha+beta barrel domain-containing protein n=1 Tax=Rhizoctonia solani TaxID=456999 RepID=A0A8H2WJA0_9AGAM|nr:unnamed protein product [Rhizoctonia solani]